MLIDLKTDLKSLNWYGKNNFFGNGNQPYIQTPIPDDDDPPSPPPSNDSMVRFGTVGATKRAIIDTERLTKWFADKGGVNGLLFTAKLNLLSRISVKTEATYAMGKDGFGRAGYAGGLVNQGVYLPTSTLAQSLVGFTGTHLNLFGIDPTGLAESLSIHDYFKVLRSKNQDSTDWEDGGVTTNNTPRNPIYGMNEFDLNANNQPNRLVQLKHKKIQTRVFNINDGEEKLGFWEKVGGAITGGIGNLLSNKEDFKISDDDNEILKYGGGPGSILGIGKTRINFEPESRTGYDSQWYQSKKGNEGWKPGFFWNPKQPQPTISDFRKPILEATKDPNTGVYSSTIMSIAPSYDPSKRKTIDNTTGRSRINYTDPGTRGNIIDYTQGKLDDAGVRIGAVDRINALPIYQSEYVISDPVKNDLIKFRIAAINNDKPNQKEWIHFRAYIDSFSDSYQANWNEERYMGRGEGFWKYGSFGRNIDLSFTVAAQSIQEIMVMYKKLNFLASNLAPAYSKAGYMAGPLIQLTLGGWCYELPGFIRSLTLDVPQESPWEIGIPNHDQSEKEFGGIKYRDPSVKEMPMICKVSNFSFIPIHQFKPAKQENKFDGVDTIQFNTGAVDKEGNDEIQTVKKMKEYGKQRYIQLDDGSGNNSYDNADDVTSKTEGLSDWEFDRLHHKEIAPAYDDNGGNYPSYG